MKKQAVSAQAQAALSAIIDSETLLSRLPVKDRQRFETQVAACEAKTTAGPGRQWRRMVCVLMTLAPLAAKLTSTNTAQFFIPDGGKYRKQVFALHALDDGGLAVYMYNILDEAIRAGLLAKPPKAAAAAAPTAYRLVETGELVTVDPLDGSTPNPDPCYKDMTGWSRKAMCVTLSPTATPAALAAVEQLCALASLKWAVPAAVTV